MDEMVGARFGRLVVEARAGSNKHGKALWVARCECGRGTRVTATTGQLRSKHTRSCGCLRSETAKKTFTRHGLTAGLKTAPEMPIWSGIRRRCADPSDPLFPRFGARGIQVCERWRGSFAAFIEDMGRRPSAEHSLVRIDPDGNFDKANCRWAVRREQPDERSSGRKITVDGETHQIAEWARRTGRGRAALAARLARGWSPVEAITLPRGGRKSAATGSSLLDSTVPLHEQTRPDRSSDRRCVGCGVALGVNQGQFCTIRCRNDTWRDRFWRCVDQTAGPDGCWPWTGPQRHIKGYGRFTVGGKALYAHSVALELTAGPPPDLGHTFALHACAHPPCCNPAHLRWGDHAENAADMVAHGRSLRRLKNPRAVDLTGRVFGRLRVLELASPGGRRMGGQLVWNCVCECGTTRQLPSSTLTKGTTRSCGCLKRDAARKRMLSDKNPNPRPGAPRRKERGGG